MAGLGGNLYRNVVIVINDRAAGGSRGVMLAPLDNGRFCGWYFMDSFPHIVLKLQVKWDLLSPVS